MREGNYLVLRILRVLMNFGEIRILYNSKAKEIIPELIAWYKNLLHINDF